MKFLFSFLLLGLAAPAFGDARSQAILRAHMKLHNSPGDIADHMEFHRSIHNLNRASPRPSTNYSGVNVNRGPSTNYGGRNTNLGPATNYGGVNRNYGPTTNHGGLNFNYNPHTTNKGGKNYNYYRR